MGAVRIIRDWNLLLFERALHCVLGPDDEAGHWAYQMARDYAERYTPSQGTGLTSSSAPLLQDIADFWVQELQVDPASLAAPARANKKRAGAASSTRARPGRTRKRTAGRPAFTHRQGQYLAFIDLYRKLHRRGPAESDMVRFFGVTPPAVHDMLARLEQMGLVTREPGVARSVKVAIPTEQVPALEAVAGRPW